MIRKVVPFRAWHLDWLGEPLEPGPFMVDSATLAVIERHRSYTAMIDGDVVCCGGTVEQWPTRHVCWALLGKKATENILWVTREVRAALDRVPGRVELTVRCDFPPGQRWAKALGFRVETPVLECFGPEKEPHVGFVRIN